MDRLLSFGWYCVNRGSKQWQENWENHVDLLEDNIVGPLYKVSLGRLPPESIKEWLVETITGPYPFSVSKINQMISLYVTMLWIFLLIKSLPKLSLSANINWEHLIVILFTLFTCVLFIVLGRTYEKSYSHTAKKRNSKINKDSD